MPGDLGPLSAGRLHFLESFQCDSSRLFAKLSALSHGMLTDDEWADYEETYDAYSDWFGSVLRNHGFEVAFSAVEMVMGYTLVCLVGDRLKPDACRVLREPWDTFVALD